MEREHNYNPEVTHNDKGFKLETRINGDGELKLRLHKRTKDLVPAIMEFSILEGHALRAYLSEILDDLFFEEKSEEA